MTQGFIRGIEKGMQYHLQYRQYARPLKRPLVTAAGAWEVRRGILVRLEDGEGRAGFGEIAPLPGFGGESLEEAAGWLASLGGKWEKGGEVPEGFPCCGFAISGAIGWMEGKFSLEGREVSLETAALLPNREMALAQQERLLAGGYQVFKMKIGVGPPELEMETAMVLASRAKLRLDGNGGLGEEDLEVWLRWMEGEGNVEFLEQPLPTGEWRAVQALAGKYGLEGKMALDEEVATTGDMERLRSLGWKGLFVMKPAIAGTITGSPQAGVVYSSALETGIGRETALRIALGTKFALGFGVGDLFGDDGFELHPPGSRIPVGGVGTKEMEGMWGRI